MCAGIGGSPEGVVTACAMKALGGVIQTILHPTDDDQKQRGLDAGLKFDHVYDADELVKSENTYFVATGVTDGQLVEGVRRLGPVHPHRKHRSAVTIRDDPANSGRSPRLEVARIGGTQTLPPVRVKRIKRGEIRC